MVIKPGLHFLVVEFMNQSQEYIGKLFRERYRGLYSYFLRKLGCREDAADGCQETFARLVRCNDTKGVESPGPFLSRTARNLAVDMQRRRFTKSKHMEPLEQEAAVPPEQESSLAADMQRKLIRQAIDDLPPRCREVFILHQLKNLTCKEIAKRLEISPNTVKNHYAAALVKLRNTLSELVEP
jgi:RNA polymerase sigma-70 factor (ECF subfamily)